MTSAVVMGMTGVIAKCFFYGLNTVEVTGLPQFLELLDSRQDPEKRQRGLLTGMNPTLRFEQNHQRKNQREEEKRK